ncbi:MAG: protein kinase [Polyangiales bacterium]|nr:protein kinase [Myxococcales bacterium]MCB9657327.1 protein kinase [Sandaracinaceae bacterium]
MATSTPPPKTPAATIREARPSIPDTNTFGRVAVPRQPEELDGLISTVTSPPASRLVYRRHLASGGMGEVAEVRDTGLERLVARKTIHKGMVDSRSLLSFVREARVTGQLEHPHIVPVHEIGLGEDGRLFFTMKRVDGANLRAMIRTLPEKRLSHHTLIDLVDIVIKVCQALAFAHSRGVIHLDVKASNVMVGDFGEVYLMDWGVARILNERTHGAPPADAPRVSSTEPLVEYGPAIVGTPSYMAPEQALGEDPRIDGRADVFAVGSMLYEILTRRPPYQADTVLATLVMAASARHPPLESLLGPTDVPPELARIVKRAMHPDLTERYRSVEELREDLVRFSRGGGEFPTRVYPADSVITEEGAPGDEAFFIVSGTCEVHIQGRRIREMGPGDAFGEMAILSPGPRTATVRAVTEVTVEVVNGAALAQELSTMKPWMSMFVRTLADRFRERDARALPPSSWPPGDA